MCLKDKNETATDCGNEPKNMLKHIQLVSENNNNSLKCAVCLAEQTKVVSSA